MAGGPGASTDPKSLIPGEPERMAQDMRGAVENMRKIHGVGGDLGQVDPGQWSGDASRQFRDAFGKEPQRWDDAQRRIGQAGQHLADYGDALTWAQGEAQRAIEEHTKAQAASRLAAAQYNAQAQAGAAAGAPPMAPFQDPATGAAQAAQQILDNAMSRVGQAGGDAADMLANFTDDKGNSTYKLTPKEHLEKGFGESGENSKRTTRRTAGYGQLENKDSARKDEALSRQGRASKDERAGGLSNERKQKKDTKILSNRLNLAGPEKILGQAEAEIDVLSGSLAGKAGDKALGAAGQIEGHAVGADAKAAAAAGPGGVTAAAQARAYLARGSADGEAHLGHTKAAGHAEGELGANVNAKGHAGPTGAEGSAEAFAGGRVRGNVAASMGGVGAGGHAEGWGGAGAQISGQLGMASDGKFHVGGSMGIGLGLGGKLGVDVTVDPKEVKDTAHDVADDVGNAASAVGHGVSKGVEAVGDGASSVGDAVGL